MSSIRKMALSPAPPRRLAGGLGRHGSAGAPLRDVTLRGGSGGAGDHSPVSQVPETARLATDPGSHPAPLPSPVSLVPDPPSTIGSRVREVMSNGKAESVPGLCWVTYGTATLIYQALGFADFRYPLVFAVSCVIWVMFAAKCGARGRFLWVPVWLTGISGWTTLAILQGVSWWVAVTFFGIVVGMYLRLIEVVLGLKYMAPSDGGGGGVTLVEGAGEFDRWPWMRGAEWVSPVKLTDTGTWRLLQLPPGKSATAAAGMRDEFANHLKCSRSALELVPVGESAHLLQVLIHSRSAHTKPTPCPWIHEAVDFLRPFPVGLYADGSVRSLHMLERHLLIAGITGSGKSKFMRVVVLAASKDKRVRLICLDGKESELRPFKKRCQSGDYIGLSMPKAIAKLEELEKEILRRQGVLAEMEGFKVHEAPEDAFPGGQLIVVAIDELALFTTDADADASAEFVRLLIRVAQTGRSAGVVLIAATAVTHSGVIPSELSATFKNRVAFQCADGPQSRLILGERARMDASQIPGGEGHEGKALMAGDDSNRVWRSFNLDDALVWQLAPDLPFPAIVLPEPHEKIVPDLTPRFPNGERITCTWHIKAWELLADGNYSVARLMALIPEAPTTPKPVRDLLRKWESRGWLESRQEGNKATWTRVKSDVLV